MRAKIWLCILLPLCILSVGTLTLLKTIAVSDSLLASADEIAELVEGGGYRAAQDQTAVLYDYWDKERKTLQLFIDHHTIDEVTLAIREMGAGLKAFDLPDSLMHLERLRENAEHLVHRDLPILQNIL